MGRRLLTGLGILALVGGLWSLAGSGFLAAQVPPLSPGSPVASPGASPVASPVSSPVAEAPIDPGQATVAALSTELASISLTATAQAVTQATVAVLSTQIASVAQTATANAIPAATPTPLPTETSTPAPTPTPEPTPTPTPLPEAGTVLYQADDSGGFDQWSGAGWQHLGGMLVSDGSSESFIAAPYQMEVADYAVEVELQVIGTGSPSGNWYGYGVHARGERPEGYTAGTVWWLGNLQGARMGTADALLDLSDVLDAADFDPGTDWHTYRLEVQGNVIRLLVDGAILLEAADNRYLSPGRVGLWNDGIQLNVRSFTVIAL